MIYTIEYSNVKNWRARLMPDMSIKLTIPFKKSSDKNFENNLLEKAKKLFKKYQNKKIKIENITDDYVIIFWEKVIINSIKWDIKTYLKQKLFVESYPLLEKYSKDLGFKYNNFYIKDLKTKRGSCSWIQNISLNLKLVHLPIKFLTYVIIHEVCHLKEKNHSKKFWNLVLKYCPDYKQTRKELNLY